MGFSKLVDKLLRSGEGKKLRQLEALAKGITELEHFYVEMPDDELSSQTEEFRKRYWGSSYDDYRKYIAGEIDFDADGVVIEGNGEPHVLQDTTPLQPANGETLEALLPEAFAVIREAAKRQLGQRHFNVQLMGGAALFNGNIAEMKTGEGKTLVATLPAYLASIAGLGVHVITVNDYLASYQSALMGRVFNFLDVTTGCILSNMTPNQRREQYSKDITYGTNNEFGFDYLRDNMAMSKDELVQRGHYFAIVDEVDSILIDEARTPLIISGHAEGDMNETYVDFARFVLKLDRVTNIDPDKVYLPGEEKPEPNGDYEVDEKKRTVSILDSAIDKLENHLGIDNLYDSTNTSLVQFLQNAIKAKELFQKDKEYIVKNGEIQIVDEHTGRVLSGRRYSEGMHQAIEAKEGVKIQAENQTYATITLQNYFRMYLKLAGMTGTAETEAAEFNSTYNLGVIPIPTNKPMIRKDQTDLIFSTEKGKFAAIVEDVKQRNALGQPVLLGTASVEKSEALSNALKMSGIKHEVLNAKQHEREAAIIAMAGKKGAVTVATNMAGRGTDIMLGGNSEFIAHANLKTQGFDKDEDPKLYATHWKEALKLANEQVKAEHDEVIELGGLYVIGTERHESRRIDNQLRGRSGRQGDPGESRFYISMDDDLMRLFGGGALNTQKIMQMGIKDETTPIEHPMIGRSVQSAQTKIEARNFEIRKNTLKYDDVMNKQRVVVYAERKKVLLGADISSQIQTFIDGTIKNTIFANTAEGAPESWDYDRLFRDINQIYETSITIDDLVESYGSLKALSADIIYNEIISDVNLKYAQKEENVSSETIREVERRITLFTLDKYWRKHLANMDYIKEGIFLRAMAQKDPLVEYTNESVIEFNKVNYEIREEITRILLNVSIEKIEEEEEVEQFGADNKVEITALSGPSDSSDSSFNTEDESSEKNIQSKTTQIQKVTADDMQTYAVQSKAQRKKLEKQQKKKSRKK